MPGSERVHQPRQVHAHKGSERLQDAQSTSFVAGPELRAWDRGKYSIKGGEMKAKALRGPAGQPQPPSLLRKPSPGVEGRQSQHLQTRAREGRMALWDNRISRSWWTHFIGTSPRSGCLHPTSCSHHFPLDLRGRLLLAVHSDAQLRANPSRSGMSLAVLLPMPRLAP